MSAEGRVSVPDYLGSIFIICAASLWGLIGPLSKFCLQDGVSPIEIAFWRCFLAAILFLIHVWRIGWRGRFNLQESCFFLVYGAIGIGGLFAINFTVVREGGAALAAVLMYTAPVWVAIASYLLFKEALSWKKIFAITLSLAGVVCISFGPGASDGVFTPQVLGLGLLSGILYACAYIFGKYFAEKCPPMVSFGLAMAIAAFCLFPFVPFSKKNLLDWSVLFILGIASTYCAYCFYGLGLKRIQATKASVLATTEPFFATLVAWWWWGETFSWLGWMGTVLIIGAVFVLMHE